MEDRGRVRKKQNWLINIWKANEKYKSTMEVCTGNHMSAVIVNVGLHNKIGHQNIRKT